MKNCLLFACLAGITLVVAAEPARLVAHWPLKTDANDVVGSLHGAARHVAFENQGRPSAWFNGRDSVIAIPDAEAPHLGQRNSSLALAVKCQTPMSNTLGDLLSKFDPERRSGWKLHIAGSAPGYDAMSDTRHVHFGIDNDYFGEWEDHGKPWPSNFHIPCLIVYNGELYCSIADADKTEDKARVYRFAGGREWVDAVAWGTICCSIPSWP